MKIGDVVQLKSGGPKMVIREDQGVIDSGHWFTCEYFDGKGIYRTRDFQETSLSIVIEDATVHTHI